MLGEGIEGYRTALQIMKKSCKIKLETLKNRLILGKAVNFRLLPEKDAPEAEIQAIIGNLTDMGLKVTVIQGSDYNVFGVVGDTTRVDEKIIAANPHVDHVSRVAARLKKPTVCSIRRIPS